MPAKKKSCMPIATGSVFALVILLAAMVLLPETGCVTTTRREVQPAKVEDLLADDRLEDKSPAFEPDLVDPRSFGPDDNPWRINASGAVIRLDVPDLVEDRDADLLVLYPSYAEAAAALQATGRVILPSLGMIAGKAKQFDDGLFAALERYLSQNEERGVRDVERLVRELSRSVGEGTAADAWLRASLEVGEMLDQGEQSSRSPATAELMRVFLADARGSKPVGFYTWSPELESTFLFLRFLQQPLDGHEEVEKSLITALEERADLREQYARVLRFYSRLTNPPDGPSLLDRLEGMGRGAGESVRFLPYAEMPEAELFEKLYPLGAPGEADLMRDFIRAIRDGSLELEPTATSGWYDYQLFALETFLMPERGAEHEKLLLTRKYKLRMLEAFKAIVTTIRETHMRTAAVGEAAIAPLPPEENLSPRLLVEPNPTYFLRTARSYAFLERFLREAVPDLDSLVGLREGGVRDEPLGRELAGIRGFFYGLYLVSCEGIGLRAQDLSGEVGALDEHRTRALSWLERGWLEDPDLAVDARVIVPIYYDPPRSTRYWCTLGVRGVKLQSRWATPPRWRAAGSDGAWEEIPRWRLTGDEHVLLTAEFAEVERVGMTPPTREEFREICDAAEGKADLLERLAD